MERLADQRLEHRLREEKLLKRGAEAGLAWEETLPTYTEDDFIRAIVEVDGETARPPV